MEEMIFNLADTHLFFNDLEVSLSCHRKCEINHLIPDQIVIFVGCFLFSSFFFEVVAFQLSALQRLLEGGNVPSRKMLKLNLETNEIGML